LAGKADRSLSNLNATGEDHFLEQDFTIIYPNGGTAANPANITTNTRYIESNPFTGYYVRIMPEIFYNNDWLEVTFLDDANSGAYGISTQTTPTQIGIRTGNASIAAGEYQPINTPGNISSAPCRIKVWKIGKIPTA
jgi:hypothetical protein